MERDKPQRYLAFVTHSPTELERAFEVVPFVPTGQWKVLTVYRKNVKGIVQAPPYLMWNVEKA